MDSLTSNQSNSQTTTVAEDQMPSKYYVRVLLVRHGQSESNISPHLIAGRASAVGLIERGKYEAYLLGRRLSNASVEASIDGSTSLLVDEIHCSTARRAVETTQIMLGVKHNLSNDQDKHASDVHNLTKSHREDAQSVKSLINQSLDSFINQSIFQTISQHVDLEEQSQGPYEGQDRTLVYTESILRSMAELNVDFALPGGESINQVADRASSIIQSRVNHYLKSDNLSSTNPCLIFVCHGMVIRSLLLRWAGDDSTDIPPANQTTNQTINRHNCWRIPVRNTSITDFHFSHIESLDQLINQSVDQHLSSKQLQVQRDPIPNEISGNPFNLPLIKQTNDQTIVLTRLNDCSHLKDLQFPF